MSETVNGPIRQLALQIGEIFWPPGTPKAKQVRLFANDAAFIIGELGEGPFEVVEEAEGIKPDGLGIVGFDGTVILVDDVAFAAITGKDETTLRRLTEAEWLHLWRYSVGERCPGGCAECNPDLIAAVGGET